MRKLALSVATFLVIFFSLSSMVSAENPKNLRARGFVNDYASFLSMDTARKMEEVLQLLKKNTQAELVFVGVNQLDGNTIEEFAVELFQKWGIGQKNKDNGVLLLISKKERKIRIEVGYGLEGVLPDALCGDVIREMVKRFQTLGYDQGITYGVFRLGTVIAEEQHVPFESLLQGKGFDYDNLQNLNRKYSQKKSNPLKILFILFWLFFIFFGRLGFWGLFILGENSRGSHWRDGGWGSGFGGGFGGFGGGSSGGGGASGSW